MRSLGEVRTLDEARLKKHLLERGYREESLPAYIDSARKFTEYLSKDGGLDRVRSASVSEFEAYSQILIENRENTVKAYDGIAECALLAGNTDVYVAALEIADGWNVVHTLAKRIEAACGDGARAAVFADVTMPEIGLTKADQSSLMQTIVNRMIEVLPEETCRSVLTGLKHGLSDMTPDDVREDREILAESDSVDDFLAARHRNWISKLEELKTRGEPFWTITVDDELLEYLRSNPEIGGGVRYGNKIYETKIPYMPQRYLRETDPVLKRYHFCHCPWARDAIRHPDKLQVPAVFCHCSLGYSKNYWDALFGCSVEGEIVESVLNGDMRCRMAFTLPDQYQISHGRNGG
jgi:hypothetical protein